MHTRKISMSIQKLGRYQIVSEVGKGAMGTVYKAIDPLIERTVAIKAINLDLSKEELASFEERFYREAKSALGRRARDSHRIPARARSLPSQRIRLRRRSSLGQAACRGGPSSRHRAPAERSCFARPDSRWFPRPPPSSAGAEPASRTT